MSGSKNILYKNAPLVEAAFEIRFPGEPSVECHRDVFYSKVRDEYPKLYVPSLQPGGFPSLQPYQYHNDDNSIIILTALNKISISTKKYNGFNDFKNETLSILKKFNDSYKIKIINRVGLRYINIIPFVREDGLVPYRNFLNIDFILPESLSKNFSNLNFAFTSKIEGGSITTKIATLQSDDKKNEALLLDFDFAKEDSLKMNKIDKYISEGHLITKNLFEEFITDEYRTYLKGEVL